LSSMELMHFTMRVDHELSRAAKKIAVYASAEGLAPGAVPAGGKGGTADGLEVGGVAATVLAEGYAAAELGRKIPDAYRRQMGMQGGLSLLQSKVLLGNDLVDLVAEYGMDPRGKVFGIPLQKLTSRARVHAWTGYRLGSGSGGGGTMEDPIVYITDTGTVYHLSRSCTHLDLSIQAVDRERVGERRNAGGGKYKACGICGGGSGTVYITNEGDRYHSSLTCSGLKRTIHEVPLSKVGGRPPCSRCGR
nr:hypothetical protein [Lachnospiraceae bacterium]